MGVFSDTQKRLWPIYGAMQSWGGDTGVRCNVTAKGRVTLYRKNIAAGNLAELAFEVKSMAARAGDTEDGARAAVNELFLATGQPVKIDPRHKWPRVGLSKSEHIDILIAGLERYFDLPSVA
ncbi:hypothetical protein [Pseudomonas paralcaligenes]|uniref:hypothetical protein n=1 Tax=Pseudomonas paralcaligenes TaxID=2772558 RepID=UPI001C816CD4|nr:hypothetical protein [Pseudomonas paralcaligenes]